MRKDVKRARLWLINNLSHKAKKLSDKKSNQQEREKNLRKVERCHGEIQVLKRIEIDEVSKFALCRQLEEKAVQKEMEKLDTEQRAMLRLASHKFIQSQVTKFRETHPVPLDRLVLLIRSLGLQYQKKKLKEKSDLENPSQNSGDAEVPKKTCPTKKGSSSVPKPADTDVNSVDPVTTNDEEPEKKSTSTESEESLTAHPVDNEGRSDAPRTLVTADGKALKTNQKVKLRKGGTSHDFSLEKPRGKVAWPESKIVIDKKIGTMEIKQLHLDKMPLENIDFSSQPKSSHHSSIFELPKDSFFLGGVDPPSDHEDETFTSPPSKQKQGARKSHPHSQVTTKDFPRTANLEHRKNEKRANMLANHSPLGNIRQFGVPNTAKPSQGLQNFILFLFIPS